MAQMQIWAAAKLMPALCRGSLVHRELFLGISLPITREVTIPSLIFLDSFILTSTRGDQCWKRFILGNTGQSSLHMIQHMLAPCKRQLFSSVAQVWSIYTSIWSWSHCHMQMAGAAVKCWCKCCKCQYNQSYVAHLAWSTGVAVPLQCCLTGNKDKIVFQSLCVSCWRFSGGMLWKQTLGQTEALRSLRVSCKSHGHGRCHMQRGGTDVHN